MIYDCVDINSIIPIIDPIMLNTKNCQLLNVKNPLEKTYDDFISSVDQITVSDYQDWIVDQVTILIRIKKELCRLYKTTTDIVQTYNINYYGYRNIVFSSMHLLNDKKDDEYDLVNIIELNVILPPYIISLYIH